MDAHAKTTTGIKMNQKAYIDFRSAQETYLKENGWHWTCLPDDIPASLQRGKVPLERCVKWNKNGVVWMYLDDAVSKQILDDMMQFPGKGNNL